MGLSLGNAGVATKQRISRLRAEKPYSAIYLIISSVFVVKWTFVMCFLWRILISLTLLTFAGKTCMIYFQLCEKTNSCSTINVSQTLQVLGVAHFQCSRIVCILRILLNYSSRFILLPVTDFTMVNPFPWLVNLQQYCNRETYSK